jgi:transposase InsO family protein
MATHLPKELVVDALEMAHWRRNADVGLIHHTHRGVQYTPLSFIGSKRLEEAGILASMGGVGWALDNAISWSLVARLKCELLLLLLLIIIIILILIIIHHEHRALLAGRLPGGSSSIT